MNWTIGTISTHTPLAGRDIPSSLEPVLITTFLLTRPLRDVTDVSVGNETEETISTHTPLAGRDRYI